MSRSLGDRIAHSVGVSSVPEVKEFLIDVDDKFVVIASDGLWEFMENEEVSRIVGPYYDDNQPEAAANAVRKAAHTRWIEVSIIQNLIVVVPIGRGGYRRHHGGDRVPRTAHGIHEQLLRATRELFIIMNIIQNSTRGFGVLGLLGEFG